jgi:hypothetical protein
MLRGRREEGAMLATMWGDGFDERFKAAGARSFFASPVRLAMAGLLWAVLGLNAGWQAAGYWAAVVLLIEWPMRELTRPMARGLRLSRAETILCMAVYGVAAAVWSSAGAMLWSANPAAIELAAGAFFAGCLLHGARQTGRARVA